MTLQELKDKYAENQGYDNWIELLAGSYELIQEYDKHIYNIIVLAQKEALKNAHQVFLNNDVGDALEQELILNENNLIK